MAEETMLQVVAIRSIKNSRQEAQRWLLEAMKSDPRIVDNQNFIAAVQRYGFDKDASLMKNFDHRSDFMNSYINSAGTQDKVLSLLAK